MTRTKAERKQQIIRIAALVVAGVMTVSVLLAVLLTR